MQTYMQLATETLEKITRKLKYKRLDIQLWLSNNGIKDKGLQEEIMCSIRDIIKRKEDFDEHRPLLNLPQKHKRDIKRLVCKSLLENVPTLGKASKDKYLWSLICDSLKPVYLIENTYIIRQGEVLDAMLFINQGTVCTFSTNDENGIRCLNKGDFFGEELLNWVLAPLASSGPSEQIPLSKITLKCKTKVEVFSLWVDDLKNIVSGNHLRIKKFRRIIGCTDAKDELEDLAAKSLQAAFAAFHRHMADPKQKTRTSLARKATKCAMCFS
ncbi:Cyclic nucleotide-gated ion channel 1 [Morella rubra]|uniref:Cyclic nucleotide-gated ion channel 1 n=1 Tax=Morella rubra TaxID=262757 RepID=A0A6A1V0R9_9ROSI|nr:Cyclic nucleotide-gated ion channel 1 [Morella rubra]KAB1206245.1 Cyclic nucleotide-gated ion channel 1 [Morella rubra]